jgi:hypothetical protein
MALRLNSSGKLSITARVESRQRPSVGKVGKGVKCSVSGCANEAVRSVSAEDASRAGLRVTTGSRSYLCKDHYKEMKKKTKKDRQVERWRMKP